MQNSKLTSFFKVNKISQTNKQENDQSQDKQDKYIEQNQNQKGQKSKSITPSKQQNSNIQKSPANLKNKQDNKTPQKTPQKNVNFDENNQTSLQKSSKKGRNLNSISPQSNAKNQFIDKSPKRKGISPKKNIIDQHFEMEIESDKKNQNLKRLKKGEKQSPKKPKIDQNKQKDFEIENDQFTHYAYTDQEQIKKTKKNQKKEIQKPTKPKKDLDYFPDESNEQSEYELELDDEISDLDEDAIARLNDIQINSGNKKTKRQQDVDTQKFNDQKQKQEKEQNFKKQAQENLRIQQEKEKQKVKNYFQELDKKAQEYSKQHQDTLSIFLFLELTGKTFVITGLFHQIERDPLMDKIKELGGKVTGSVSGKTTYLCAGHILEDGRPTNQSSKFKKAQDLKTVILEEDKILEMIDFNQEQPMEIEEQPKNIGRQSINFDQIPQNTETVEYQGGNAEDLWTKKYKPQKITEIIGNLAVIQSVITWLKDWNDVVFNGNKKPTAFKFGNVENPNARACLISGPPGVGKTTFVRLLAKEFGYDLIEHNASDVRNKKSIFETTNHLTDNKLLGSFHKNKVFLIKQSNNNKFIILMDEVDGMSGHNDRGGNAELIKIIKTSKTPIICVCNDRQNPKIRSLANSCYDRKFQKPTKQQIAKRVMQINYIEGVQMDQNAVELLCESLQNDLRQIFNYLGLQTKKQKQVNFQKQINYSDAKKDSSSYKMDESVTTSNFDAASKFLNRFGGNLTYRDKLKYFFIDYDLIPLLYQENYLNSVKRDVIFLIKFDMETMEKVCLASESIGYGDMISKTIHRHQEWALLPELAFNSTIYPSTLVSSQLPFPKFPEWLGKNSSMRKTKRLLKEIKYAIGRHVTGSQKALHQQYVPTLLQNIINLYKQNKVDDVINYLEEYNLNPDLVKEHLVELNYIKHQADPFKSIDTKIKTAVTRTYNSKNKSSVKDYQKAKDIKSISIQIDNVQKYDPNLGEGIIEESIVESEDEKSNIVETKSAKKPKQAAKGKGAKSKK